MLKALEEINLRIEDQGEALNKLQPREVTIPSPSVGPRGGDLTAHQHPERRQAKLNVKEVAEGVSSLHRFQDTATNGIKNEQPWHLMAAYMLLAGRTNSEIALAAGVTAIAVSHVRSQRWFQERLAILANETGEDIRGSLVSHAQDAINTIAELMDSAESERTRLSAATTLLEHANGKAVQKIVSNVAHSVHASPQDEMDAIQQELRTLRGSSTQPNT